MSEIVVVEEAVKIFQRGSEEVRAIDGVSLRISNGEFLAVVGPSGSGKTTLLNLIGCVDRPTTGRVNVHGMETGELTERALATIRSTTIGFVFQQFFLIPTLTAAENVMVPGRFCAKRTNNLSSKAIKLLDLVGLANRADHLPHELSGGEMQRVALARALINEPEILLADEPTGNLDTKSAEVVASIFKELNEGGLTIVVVTHNPDIAANATRAVHLHDGTIVREQQVRPAPVWVQETETRPEATTVPEYMPASLKKRKWGSPRLAGLLALLGAAMFAVVFMPFLEKQPGQWSTSPNIFTVSFYRGNNLAKTYYGRPAVLLTGTWPMVLGLLLIAAGILLLFRQKRFGGWSAIVIGSLGTFIAAFNLVMINARLGANAAQGLIKTSPGYGTWALLVISLATIASGVLIVSLLRSRSVENRGVAE